MTFVGNLDMIWKIVTHDAEARAEDVVEVSLVLFKGSASHVVPWDIRPCIARNLVQLDLYLKTHPCQQH